jgi:hypothetical protein
MLNMMEIGLFENKLLWMLQIPIQARSPEEAALFFSGPRFFVALLSGVILAFAFQLLFANLSVAAGISYFGRRSSSNESQSNLKEQSSNSSLSIRKIGFGLGLWTLVTVCISLFSASLLAVRLSLLFNPLLGSIIGLVIWGTYFSLMVWLSTTTVGSFLGSALNSMLSGFQTIINTASALVGNKISNQRVTATAEATAMAVKRGLMGTKDSLNLRETIEDYVESLQTPRIDVQEIRREFEDLLRVPELQNIGEANKNALKEIDRNTFKDLVQSRTDLSVQEVDRLADQLYRSWRRFLQQQDGHSNDSFADIQNYLRSALPEQLKSSELSRKLDQLMALFTQEQRAANQPGDNQANKGVVSQAVQFGITTLMGTILGRQDLSDLDVETILQQFGKLREQLSQQTEGLVHETVGRSMPFAGDSTIRFDIEHYVLTAQPWQLNTESVNQEFRDVLYDPAADPRMVRQELESVERKYFVQLLTQKGVFTQAKIDEIADRLDSVRTQVLYVVQQEEMHIQSQDFYRQLENYLRTASQSDLASESVQRYFMTVLEDIDLNQDALRSMLMQLDWNKFKDVLIQRQTLGHSEIERVVRDLEVARDRALQEIQLRQVQEESLLKGLQARVETYLRDTHKDELNPEGIKRDLHTLSQDPQVGMIALQSRLSAFDRDTLVKLLSQRQDLSEVQINQTIDQLLSVWHGLTQGPQVALDKAKDQYNKVSASLEEYLRNTHLEELNPEGIKRDLSKLFDDPKVGVLTLRKRLSQIDRETLVKLLSQRDDLSEAQVNQTIDQIQLAIRQVVKSPRRFATRTQAKMVDFESNLENYLRNTRKEELNPEGIKRDLQLLLQDPRSGLGSLSDRLSRMDRSTLVALLSQRSDMTEEEANRIVVQIESVRDQFVQQVRDAQRKIQSVVDRVFARIRNYLNAFERPELNYDGIRRDVRQLFSDPQVGFEALRERLSHFNRDTLVAILSSRDDISEADANRIIDQIEGARNNVLQRAERIQHAAQERLETLKQQTQKQAEETRKAAEAATWWLFSTATISAVLSAIVGAIAVGL